MAAIEVTVPVAGVLVVTIDRPEARNAVNREVAEGIGAAMERLDAEPELRVGILTGAGGTFCAGMDLKGLVPAPGAGPDPDELRAHCRAALAAYRVPAEFVVVAEMPLNASGKILKRELRVQDSTPVVPA